MTSTIQDSLILEYGLAEIDQDGKLRGILSVFRDSETLTATKWIRDSFEVEAALVALEPTALSRGFTLEVWERGVTPPRKRTNHINADFE